MPGPWGLEGRVESKSAAPQDHRHAGELNMRHKQNSSAPALVGRGTGTPCTVGCILPVSPTVTRGSGAHEISLRQLQTVCNFDMRLTDSRGRRFGKGRGSPTSGSLHGSAIPLLGPGHDVYQFGVASGKSLVRVLSSAYRDGDSHLWGFDSFDGVPEEENGEITAWRPKQYKVDKQNSPRRTLAKLAKLLGSTNRADMVRGLFSQSLAPDLACARSMKPAAYIDIDCDIYTGAWQALDWAFAHGVAQIGTVVGYDDWWVIPCSLAGKGNLMSAVDIFAYGEAKAHAEITRKYGVRFECVCGPCHATSVPSAPCKASGSAAPQASCWRPLFVIRELSSLAPSHGFDMSMQNVSSFLSAIDNHVCTSNKGLDLHKGNRHDRSLGQ